MAPVAAPVMAAPAVDISQVVAQAIAQTMAQTMALQAAGAFPGMQPAAPPTPPEPKVIATKRPEMPSFADGTSLGEEQAQNLDLIMGVPLEVTVEIGRTRKKVQDVLSFTKGSLVILDKLAGDQVDLFVNGKCIAKGEVVVIDDNFGIRISEILNKPELGEVAKTNR